MLHNQIDSITPLGYISTTNLYEFGSELISLGLTFNSVKNNMYDKLSFFFVNFITILFYHSFQRLNFWFDHPLISLFYISLISPQEF